MILTGFSISFFTKLMAVIGHIVNGWLIGDFDIGGKFQIGVIRNLISVTIGIKPNGSQVIFREDVMLINCVFRAARAKNKIFRHRGIAEKHGVLNII